MQTDEASTSYRVGILTISDSASKDQLIDKSGPLLETLFNEVPGFQVLQRAIVADDTAEIQRAVRKWVDVSHNGANLVICTGGTGFGQRDVTPEAIEPLLDKQTQGLTQDLINYSLSKTPLAALSRLISGIRHRRSNASTLSLQFQTDSALIVALPGSLRAVKECCEILLASDGLLSHALDLIAGGDGRQKHEEMQLTETETDTGSAHGHNEHSLHHRDHHQYRHHGQHHHHGHHAPTPRTIQQEGQRDYKTHDPTSLSVTARHRTSPYPIIDLEEALDLILKETITNEAVTLSVDENLRGYTLADQVKAPRALPPRATTNVDGYALLSADTPPGAYDVVTREAEFTKGKVFRINTGQAVPAKADAVLMVEDTDLLESDGNEEKRIQVKAQIDPGENIRKAGSDVREGQLVLPKGLRISELGGEIGTLAFLGYSSVKVYRKPRVAILSTGNELFDAAQSAKGRSDDDAWGFRVFDSNRPSLRAALEGQGFEVVDLGIVGDNVDKTLDSLNRGLEEADVVLSTGGTSMGESDLLKPLMKRKLRNGKIHFGRVAMKPGKPTTFASAKASNGKKKLLFALPGNPASALVCFYIFVMPCLRKMSGFPSSQLHLPKVKVKLQDEMRCVPRPEFHRVVVSSIEGQLCATSTGSQRSSGMHSMATANGLVCVPSGQDSLKKGSMADVILLGPIM